MPKMSYFLEKNWKIRPGVGGSAPKLPLAFGGWGSALDHVLLFSYITASLKS